MISRHLSIVEAIAAAIGGLGLPGAPTVYQKKLPTDRDVTLPAIVVSLAPGEGELMAGGLNQREDLGWPTLVTFLKAENANMAIDAGADLPVLWRERVIRLFHDQTLPAVTQVYQTKVEPRSIIDLDAFVNRNLFAGALLVRATSRESRITLGVADSFTGADGTPLATYNPAWVTRAGAWTLLSNQLKSDGSASSYAIRPGGATNGIVSCDVTVSAAPLGFPGLVLRETDANNNWQCWWDQDEAEDGGNLKIVETVAGVQTVRAQVAVSLTAGQTYTFVAEVYGDKITFSVGDTTLSFTGMASGGAATNYGVRAGSNGNHRFDNFSFLTLS